MNSIHNNGENDKSLNDELDRLGSAYARLDQDEPPKLLDQAILNRARRAVERKPRWMKFSWLHGLTTTAVFVLAFSLILNQPETTPIPQEGADDTEVPGLTSGLEAGEQAREKRLREVKSVDFMEVMKTRGAERQDTPGEAPAAPAPMSVAREIQPVESTGQSSEIQESLRVEESRLEKRIMPDMDTKISGVLEEDIKRDEADLVVNAMELEVTHEESLFTTAADAVVEEAEKPLDPDSTIEQELRAIIELKQAGDSRWIAELESFTERYPDYPLPDVLTDRMP